MPEKGTRRPRQPLKAKRRDDSFASTAKRLECDPSEERFDRALREIAKPKVKPAQ